MKSLLPVSAFALLVYAASFMPVSAMTTQDFLQQLAEIESQISVIEARLLLIDDIESATSTNFALFVEDTLTHSSFVETEAAAIKRCESLAFDPTYMWKEVRCEFNATTIYDDIFVAG